MSYEFITNAEIRTDRGERYNNDIRLLTISLIAILRANDSVACRKRSEYNHKVVFTPFISLTMQKRACAVTMEAESPRH